MPPRPEKYDWNEGILFRRAAAPTQDTGELQEIKVGDLWCDSDDGILYTCVNITPVTWTRASGPLAPSTSFYTAIDPTDVAADSNLTLTGTYQDISGTSTTLDVKDGDSLFVVAVFDGEASSDTGVGRIVFDGVGFARTCQFVSRGCYIQCGQQDITADDAAYALKLQAKLAAGTGSGTVYTIHTHYLYWLLRPFSNG